MTLIDIAGEVLSETEKAYQFSDGARRVWLPKSQVEWHEEDQIMVIPEWLAKDKDLI